MKGSGSTSRSASRSTGHGSGGAGDEDDDDTTTTLLIVVGLVLLAVVACWLVWCVRSRRSRRRQKKVSAALQLASNDEGLKRVAEMAAARLILKNREMAGGAPNVVPPTGRYVGTFKQGGRSRIVFYELVFSKDGSVVGTCEEEEGTCEVKGIYDSESAMYRWGEVAQDASYVGLESEPVSYGSAIVKDRASHIEVTVYPVVDKDKKHRFRLAGQHCSSTGAIGALDIVKKD